VPGPDGGGKGGFLAKGTFRDSFGKLNGTTRGGILRTKSPRRVRMGSVNFGFESFISLQEFRGVDGGSNVGSYFCG